MEKLPRISQEILGFSLSAEENFPNDQICDRGKGNMKRVVALVPAAGRGRRMGSEVPKTSLLLGGIPLLKHTLFKFETCREIQEVIPLVPPEEVPFWEEEILQKKEIKKVRRILAGGEERQDSVFLGLQAVAGEAEIVVIHDGARPFVSPELIKNTLAEMENFQAVITALPVEDTVKEISPRKEVVKTLERSFLWFVQTPQTFTYSLIFYAHEKAHKENFFGTDDAALIERLGIPVRVIEGSRLNFKITTPEDLLLAEALLKYQQQEKLK